MLRRRARLFIGAGLVALVLAVAGAAVALAGPKQPVTTSVTIEIGRASCRERVLVTV